MKRVILLLLAMMFLVPSVCFGAPVIGKNNCAGLFIPAFSWNNPNWIDKQGGQKISDLGINLMLGVTYRRFFEPVETNKFNTYWAGGTGAVIFPYLGIGGDYVWDNGWYLGIGTVWIFPEIHGGLMF